jgi:hypothetical protein
VAATPTTPSAATAGSPARGRGGSEPPAHARRRRNIPLTIFGVLVVAGCALAFAVTSLHAGRGRQVLAMSRSVPAGHALTGGDLMAVRVTAPPSVHLVGSGERASVIGQPAAVRLAAGSLLTREALGAGPQPAAGEAVVGVALRPGRYPPGLAAGARVRAYAVPAESAAGSAAPQGLTQAALPIGDAAVLDVHDDQDGGGVVVELQLRADEVPAVTAAAATGTVALAMIPPQGE